MPRPSKFDEATARTILTGIRVGLSYDLACQAAGVSFETFRQWRLGKFPRGTDPEAKTAFLEGIERARGIRPAVGGHHFGGCAKRLEGGQLDVGAKISSRLRPRC